MSALLLILLSVVLVNVMALTRVPAWRPFEGVTGTFAGAWALAIAALITVPAVAAITWSISKVLLEPNGLGYLRTLAFIAVALAIVPLVEFMLRRDGRLQPQHPGFSLLLTTNSAVLGVARSPWRPHWGSCCWHSQRCTNVCSTPMCQWCFVRHRWHW
jgi:electron transport complex protein RnfA